MSLYCNHSNLQNVHTFWEIYWSVFQLVCLPIGFVILSLVSQQFRITEDGNLRIFLSELYTKCFGNLRSQQQRRHLHKMPLRLCEKSCRLFAKFEQAMYWPLWLVGAVPCSCTKWRINKASAESFLVSKVSSIIWIPIDVLLNIHEWKFQVKLFASGWKCLRITAKTWLQLQKEMETTWVHCSNRCSMNRITKWLLLINLF